MSEHERQQQREHTQRLDAEARPYWNFGKFIGFVLAIAALKALLRVLANSLRDFDPSAHRAAVSVTGMCATGLLLAITLSGGAHRKRAVDTGPPRVLSRFGGWLTVFQASVAMGLVAFWGGVLRAAFSRGSGPSSTSAGQFVMASVAPLPTLVVLYGLVLIVQRRPVAKTFWKAVLSAATVLLVAGSLSPRVSIDERETLLDAVSWAVIWLFYWKKSYRVRSTFVEHDGRATERARLTDLGASFRQASRSGATRSASPRRAPAGDGAQTRGLAGWINLNPLYAGLGFILACGLAWFSPAVWHATYRAGLAIWPPSLAGSWGNPEREALEPAFTLTLAEHAGRVTGFGTLNGAPVSFEGVDSGRAADLTVVSGSSRLGATGTMPDRSTLLLTFKLRDGDGRTFRLERR